MGSRLVLRLVLGGAAVALATGVVSVVGAGTGTAWTSSPGSGLAGTVIEVGAGTDSPCRWSQPIEPGGGDLAFFDGTRVEVRLEGAAMTIPLGDVPVSAGGAWSGSVTVPSAPVGLYSLFARCVIEHPDLDGTQSFDFDPHELSVQEAPPPITITAPPEIVPPAVATNPVEVAGVQVARPVLAAPARPRSAPAAPTAAPELPNTGHGTLGIALAGLGALMIGGLALWWGGRGRPTGTGTPAARG